MHRQKLSGEGLTLLKQINPNTDGSLKIYIDFNMKHLYNYKVIALLIYIPFGPSVLRKQNNLTSEPLPPKFCFKSCFEYMFL